MRAYRFGLLILSHLRLTPIIGVYSLIKPPKTDVLFTHFCEHDSLAFPSR